MLPDYKFFKCNILGGFRLSDLNLNVKQGQYFSIDSHVAETSRAAIAALKAKWMVEVDEEEASKHLSITKSKKSKTPDEEKPAINSVGKTGVAVPNIKEVNKKLESRQALRQKEQESDKVAIPNIAEVEKNIKARDNDSIYKKEAGDKVIESPAAHKQAAKAESDDEGVTTVKSLSKDEDEEYETLKDQITTDLDQRVRRRRKVETEVQQETV